MNPTPDCPVDLYEFHCNLLFVDHICHLEYVPAEQGSVDSFGAPYESDSDEFMVLISIYQKGTDLDIVEIVQEGYVKKIERMALEAYKDKTP